MPAKFSLSNWVDEAITDFHGREIIKNWLIVNGYETSLALSELDPLIIPKKITSGSTTSNQWSLFSMRAITLASECSCRSTVLEKLAQEFNNEHQRVKLCNQSFNGDESTSFILKHMDDCEGVTLSEDNKIGDKISSQLNSLGIQRASRGGYFFTFESLCIRIHSSELLKTDEDQVVIPSSLNDIDKRFMIKYLIGKAHDIERIVIYGLDGELRSPREYELMTPPKKQKYSITDNNNDNKEKRKNIYK